jgi:hypothetical protein
VGPEKMPPPRRLTTVTLAVCGMLIIAGFVTAIDWPTVGRWARPHAVPPALFTAAAGAAAVGIWLRRGRRVRAARTLPLSWWGVAAAAVVVGLVAWGATSWLLTEASTAKDVGAARVEAIKTGLGIAAGTTGIFALLLAVRRQWHSEFDAAEKNTTELYTKAADQLGSDKAPVRMAGLYALERLAQGNPLQRQSIVNVICAYLRMPYTPPETSPPDADEELHVANRQVEHEQTQEREVRLAAQRVLTDHLMPAHVEPFWDDIDLDLTNAHLINFLLPRRRVRFARFGGATFAGYLWASEATFTGGAAFSSAIFTGRAVFEGVTFIDGVMFHKAVFMDDAPFDGATFDGGVSFDHVTFTGNTSFNGAAFTGRVAFGDVTFIEGVSFDHATFAEPPSFADATQKGAPFAPPGLDLVLCGVLAEFLVTGNGSSEEEEREEMGGFAFVAQGQAPVST